MPGAEGLQQFGHSPQTLVSTPCASSSFHNTGSGGDAVALLPHDGTENAGMLKGDLGMAARAKGTGMQTMQSPHISISSPADCFFTLPLVI